jgi:hypothetical protein
MTKTERGKLFNKIQIFWSEIVLYLFAGLLEVLSSHTKSFQPSKVNIQHFKTWHFKTFFCGSFLLAWIRTGFIIRIHRPNWIQIQSGSGSGSGSETHSIVTLSLLDKTSTFFRIFNVLYNMMKPFLGDREKNNMIFHGFVQSFQFIICKFPLSNWPTAIFLTWYLKFLWFPQFSGPVIRIVVRLLVRKISDNRFDSP